MPRITALNVNGKTRTVDVDASVSLLSVVWAFGLLKVVMSWQYAPIWYHVIFTAILIPMMIVGGKLITNT